MAKPNRRASAATAARTVALDRTEAKKVAIQSEAAAVSLAKADPSTKLKSIKIAPLTATISFAIQTPVAAAATAPWATEAAVKATRVSR
jgi:hypothetical protein